MKDLVLLVDYRGAFYSSTTNNRLLCSMDVPRLRARFAERGVQVRVLEFPAVDFRAPWAGCPVLYQSAEDPGLKYKSYIEDVLLGLSLAGARLLPAYPFLRAHHNKVFMEILRTVRGGESASTLRSRGFGTAEDHERRPQTYPVVVKASAGAGSAGVRLLRSAGPARRAIRELSFSGDFRYIAKEMIKRLTRRAYVPYSCYRDKFIVQEYLPGLAHDFKMLVYGDRVYVLQRAVRRGDFRASGSGHFTAPAAVDNRMLEFAWQLKQSFGVSHASFDVAEADGRHHLIEAQFVDFGPATLERSEWHWQKQSGGWVRVEGRSELEATLAEAVVMHLQASPA